MDIMECPMGSGAAKSPILICSSYMGFSPTL